MQFHLPLQAPSIGRALAVVALAMASAFSSGGLDAQEPGSTRRSVPRLPEEAAGVDAIAQALIAAYDQVDVLALGEAHERQIDSDLRIALIRSPRFATKARFIVIECGSVTEQATLDRYVQGDTVPLPQLERIWKSTAETTNGFCDAPVYPAFLSAVRAVNSTLSPAARLHLLGGHPGPGDHRSIEDVALSVLKDQVFAKHGKALLIYGAAHFYLNGPPDYYASMDGNVGLGRRLNQEYPGRTLTVIPIGDLPRPPAVKSDVPPNYGQFDRSVHTATRPVLLPLHQAPYRDFRAEEFLGRTLTTCRYGGVCRSIFVGSGLRLGDMADAAVYVGAGGGPSLPDHSP